MYKHFFKRVLDIFGGLILLPFMLLIFIPVAIFIKLEDGGPVFFLGQRLGKNDRPFKMYKFRSMKVNATDMRMPDGSTFNSNNDPRVTKIGRFMRETSVDELPQLLNVILGDMSFVGPRPDVQSDIALPEGYDPKLGVRPGITGYSQAYFRNQTNRLEKIKNDQYYAAHVSFMLDAKIVFKTVATVFNKDNVYRVN